MFSIQRMMGLLRTNLEAAKTGKMKISDYVDMYLEGAKFYRYFGRSMSYVEKDNIEKAITIADNVKIIQKAYNIEEGSPILIYMKDFMEFEIGKGIYKFN